MHILLALDLTEDPVALIERAIPWASTLDARISLGAAIDLRFHDDQLFGPGEAAERAMELVRIQEQARTNLSELMHTIPDLLRGRLYMKLGDPVRTICGFADEEDIDLVAVGSHRRSGLARLFAGSVAESIVRSAPVPVLVLALDDAPREPSDEVNALVPIDAAEADATAISWLQRHLPQAHVLAMYALPWTPMVSGPDLVARLDADDELHGWAWQRLQEVLQEVGRPDLEPLMVQRHGERAGDTIAHVAEERDADLIAICTHGRKGIGDWALGSTAERLVRSTHRPVLVVR